VTNLDKEKQIATLSSGKKIQYDALISTMPLDITLTHRYTALAVDMLKKRRVLSMTV